MSDLDDWENELNSDNEQEEEKKKEEERKKKEAFGEEDTVDADEVAKKKKEEARKIEEEKQNNARTKTSNKVDYDKIFEERQAKMGGVQPTKKTAEETKGMSTQAKGIAVEKENEASLADQLFGGDEPGAKVTLNAEKDYKEFGRKAGEALYEGSAPYHIDKFFKEAAKSLPEHCDAKQIKVIHDFFTLMYNTKLKKEKTDDKNVKKKLAQLKGGGGKGYDRNNNTAMINDVMGAEEDEDYGNETANFKKEEEAEFDFM